MLLEAILKKAKKLKSGQLKWDMKKIAEAKSAMDDVCQAINEYKRDSDFLASFR